MLDSIRERSQSFVVKAILVFLALTFALFGIGSYVTNQPEPAVALVNGEEVSRVQFDRAVENERLRQEQQFGDFYATLAADPSFNQRLRQQVLDSLVNQKLLEQFARDSGIRMSNEQVKQAIRDYPAFQVAGQFDNDTYRLVLAQNGLSVDQFAENLRADLARSTALEGILESEFVLANEVEQIQALLNQTRSGGYVTFKLDDYKGQVELTEEEINSWYLANQNRFVVPEQVKAEFVEIDAGALAEAVEVDEARIREWYDNNRGNYETASQSRFSHILFEGDDAEARARDVQQQLAAGADFATLAAQYSDDTFSAEQGGDLDFIEQGTMDPDFEEAAFALTEIGQVSDIVETTFGFHLIQLTDRIAGEVTPFEEVRDSIMSDMIDREVKQQYYELQQQVAEQAFEIPDTFAPIAEDTDLVVRSADWFSRNSAPTALNHPAVLAQVFDQDFIAEGLNSDLIEVSDTQSIVVRVTDYQAETVKPLAEVQAQVEQALLQEKAQQLAEQAAADAASAVLAGETVELTEITAATRQNADYPAAVLRTLFDLNAPMSDLSTTEVTNLGNGDVALVVLSEVAAGTADESVTPQLREQLSGSQSQQVYAALLASLRAQADIELQLGREAE
ncbi:SurA N-terminal domain-containing protein [Pseudidiomarina taiwanensis]|uniref:Periplasmic chaperone PpiD n=1 Tax=Pseudidiomarina taiwanensis TaxID=337250 RepID=A0A432ZJQ4_9GAMM|nr:SurA N-terminal domain-containing protein [Pseudidiomarina taiwanensis]RUO78247.1 peptidylprolyl isomerase [Pseudidiomarina taiwanensis]